MFPFRASRWALLGAVLAACTADRVVVERFEAGGEGGAAPVPPAERGWRAVFRDLPGGLVSVWGNSASDVWAVGTDASDGRGPLVLHFDGAQWQRPNVLPSGDFWWVHGFPTGPVYLGGSSGVVVRFDGEAFHLVPTPSPKGIVFGIWGSGPGDVWAVGGDTLKGTGAFVWRLEGDRFVDAVGLPVDPTRTGAFFKVWGTSPSDVWIVGTDGLAIHYDGAVFRRAETGVPDLLFTVHAAAVGDRHYAAVGGSDLGVLFERRGSSEWERAALPAGTRQLFGVWLEGERGLAVGTDATILRRSAGAWSRESTPVPTDKPLHAVWIDPSGGSWAAGGDILVPPFGGGVLLHEGLAVPTDVVFVEAGIGGSGGLGAGGLGAGGVPASGGTGSGGVAGAGGAGTGGRDAGPGAGGVVEGGIDAPSDGPRESSPLGEAEAGPSVPGSDPGQVTCGANTCLLPAEKCCAEPATGVAIGCYPAADACPGAPVTCDEPADCAPGESCCLNRFIQAEDLVDIVCAPGNCIGPAVCASRADCGGANCASFLFMPTYYTCQ